MKKSLPDMIRNANMLRTIVVVGATAFLVAACNTTAGAGKDISAAGTAIENSAERNK